MNKPSVTCTYLYTVPFIRGKIYSDTAVMRIQWRQVFCRINVSRRKFAASFWFYLRYFACSISNWSQRTCPWKIGTSYLTRILLGRWKWNLSKSWKKLVFWLAGYSIHRSVFSGVGLQCSALDYPSVHRKFYILNLYEICTNTWFHSVYFNRMFKNGFIYTENNKMI